MALIFFNDKAKIKASQMLLEQNLIDALTEKPVSMTLKYNRGAGNSATQDKCFNNGELWFFPTTIHEQGKPPRYWNAFGFDPENGAYKDIIAELNSPVNDYNPNVHGGFAFDSEDAKQVYLVHNGAFSGKKKEDFLAGFDPLPQPVQTPTGQRDMLVVANLNSPHLTQQITDFLRDVEAFKNSVVNKKPWKKKKLGTRVPNPYSGYDTEQKSFAGAGYEEQFFGKGKTNREGGQKTVTYKQEEVVKALVKYLHRQLSAGYHAVNTFVNPRGERVKTEYDLGVYSPNCNDLSHVYEIKTNSGSQAIYTGVGQLKCYAESFPRAERILVAPAQVQDYLVRRVTNNHITYLGYRQKGKSFEFEKMSARDV